MAIERERSLLSGTLEHPRALRSVMRTESDLTGKSEIVEYFTAGTLALSVRICSVSQSITHKVHS